MRTATECFRSPFTFPHSIYFSSIDLIGHRSLVIFLDRRGRGWAFRQYYKITSDSEALDYPTIFISDILVDGL